MRFMVIALLFACGGSPAGLSGTWSGGFYDVDGDALSCAGHDFTGTFHLEEEQAQTLLGSWRLCDGGLNGTLTGSLHPDGAIDFTLDREGVAVIGRVGADGSLNGEAVGLSDPSARFHAHRVP